jgi:hypothetical protein
MCSKVIHYLSNPTHLDEHKQHHAESNHERMGENHYLELAIIESLESRKTYWVYAFALLSRLLGRRLLHRHHWPLIR